ncbi:MAG: peptidylprolyl isomerase [Chloroflexi bacterium]|nr:MAG: peptidylprolyl isomerase [Chloroflexota bacterium]MBL1194125.1 peptidylprolyl isomerase [Chloroflexota bacterium]NOH11418.1 peptidylprolyl isomerase [Chloroflexota bacterium]
MSQQWNAPPDMQIDADKSYKAVIKTDNGDMTCELYAAKVPNTINNFVFLAREGFYNDTIFHRVIDNFMVQGGDPTGTGSGGPGYRFADEFNAELRHNARGILSMANAGPDTNGSQFFITHGPTPHLDDRHSVFGKLVDGEDVLMSIPARDPMQTGSPAVKITSIEIIEE